MRRATILDSPPPTNTRGRQAAEPAAPRDLLMHHLGQLLELSGTVSEQCTQAAENLSEAFLDQEIPELEEALKEALGRKTQLQELKNLYTRSAHSISASDATEEQLQTIRDELKAILEAEMPTDLRSFPEVRSFHRRVFEAGTGDGSSPPEDGADENDSDADIVVERTHQSNICPITQREFENPMKNPACGHTYSEAGIHQMIRGGSAPCPVAGCRHSVNLNGLVPDVDLQRRLQRSHNRIFTQDT